MWTKKEAKEINRGFKKYNGNKNKVDLLKFKPFISAKTWKRFITLSKGLYPGAAIRCAIDAAICPICTKRFVGTSNGKLRALCKGCMEHPDAKKLVVAHREKSLIKTYGSREEANLIINAKKRKTCKKRYGTPVSFQATIVKKKIKNTLLNRYGVTNPSNSPEIQEKKVLSSRENWGTDYPMQSKALQQRVRATLNSKYGVSNISQIPSVKKKKIVTSLERYGTEHHLQNQQILEKAMLTAGRLYFVTSPKQNYLVQGYERFVISFLEKKYNLILAQFDKKYKLPTLLDNRYTFRPDFYIPSIKSFIEVKSTWTLYIKQKSWFATKRKFKMLHEAGYKCKLYLVLDKRRLVILPMYWYNLSLSELKNLIKASKIHKLNQQLLSIERATDAEENKIHDLYNFSTRRIPSLP